MTNIRQIKWAWQRVVRGYDDRVKWGFDGYFLQVIPALKEFCEEYLQNTELVNLNTKRAGIFKKTIELIEVWENQTYKEEWEGKKQNALLAYIGKRSVYYWD